MKDTLSSLLLQGSSQHLHRFPPLDHIGGKPKDPPAKQGGVVVFLTVLLVTLASRMRTPGPGDAFGLGSDHPVGPGKIESPASLTKAVLAYWFRQVEGAEVKQEGALQLLQPGASDRALE